MQRYEDFWEWGKSRDFFFEIEGVLGGEGRGFLLQAGRLRTRDGDGFINIRYKLVGEFLWVVLEKMIIFAF